MFGLRQCYLVKAHPCPGGAMVNDQFEPHITSKTRNVCVMGQQAFFYLCTHKRAAHAVLTDFWLYIDNWGTTRMGFDRTIAGSADTGLTIVPQPLL